MKASMLAVFATCAVLSLIHLLRAPSDVARTERFALGLILAASLLSPLTSLLQEVKALVPSADSPPADPSDRMYQQVLQQAFADGIAEAICKEFSIDRAYVRVTVRDFDSERMQGHVIVSLTGAAALIDHKAVKRLIEEGGLGRCDVIREAG